MVEHVLSMNEALMSKHPPTPKDSESKKGEKRNRRGGGGEKEVRKEKGLT